MKFDILHEYNEMEDNGLMMADVYTDSGVKVCQIKHLDLMGGNDTINGEVNLAALAVFLVELSDIIDDNGANYYACIDKEVNGDTITFTDDTEPFAELQGKEAFILDNEQLAYSLCAISSYFWEVAQD